MIIVCRGIYEDCWNYIWDVFEIDDAANDNE